MSRWLQQGKIVFREHVHAGFDRIVPAFIAMLSGENIGKTLVRIADPA